MSKDAVWAFPKGQSDYSENRGMTLRDYFAAKAMQGVLSSPSDPASFEAVGVFAYKVADAMLAERDK